MNDDAYEQAMAEIGRRSEVMSAALWSFARRPAELGPVVTEDNGLAVANQLRSAPPSRDDELGEAGGRDRLGSRPPTTWVFAAVGLAVKDPQAANFMCFAPVLFFVYLSSAWVPIDTMHGAVQGFARHQPVNVTIEAVRGLADGTATTSGVLASIAWSAAILAAFAWLSLRQFRTATA